MKSTGAQYKKTEEDEPMVSQSPVSSPRQLQSSSKMKFVSWFNLGFNYIKQYFASVQNLTVSYFSTLFILDCSIRLFGRGFGRTPASPPEHFDCPTPSSSFTSSPASRNQNSGGRTHCHYLIQQRNERRWQLLFRVSNFMFITNYIRIV
jgi:hypothetical protein